jgi:signal peptidase I
MEPNYSGLELVIIDKTARDLSAGEVVAIKSEAAGGNIIKRIAAVGGDTVLISDGILYVNGEQVTRYDSFSYAGIAEKQITVPDGGYFVIGDNIEESHDSRYEEIGIITEKDIIGRIIPQR